MVELTLLSPQDPLDCTTRGIYAPWCILATTIARLAGSDKISRTMILFHFATNQVVECDVFGVRISKVAAAILAGEAISDIDC